MVYEDDCVYAFLDIHPHSPGHTLVIPKKHSSNILEMSNTEVSDFFSRIHTIADIVKKKYNVQDMNITTNIGSKAGQVVFHSHVHIIPRG